MPAKKKARKGMKRLGKKSMRKTKGGLQADAVRNQHVAPKKPTTGVLFDGPQT